MSENDPSENDPSENELSENEMSENHPSENDLPEELREEKVFEANMTEKGMTTERSGRDDPLDAALANLVTSYTDRAPTPPDVNRVLSDRAARSGPRAAGPRSWLRPAIAGLFGMILLGGGAYALVAGNSADGGQVLVPADETATTDPLTDGDSDGASTDGVGGVQDGDETATTDPVTDPDVPNQILEGAEAAADLPDSAPDSYWGILAGSYDLVEIESRTGKVLTNLGGWGEPTNIGEGELIQALDSVEIGADGALFVDDCCEPAFGNVYRLEAGQVFDPEISIRRPGLNPIASPSEELVMLNVGGLVQIVDADYGADSQVTVAELGEIEGPGGMRFVPLAWIDDQTIAVRIFGLEVEEIRIYELGSSGLTERTAARRVVPDRFHMGAATRSDGMLVVAGRLPNGDPLGLAGGGDLIAEVIDPETGLVVADFDLPDLIFDLSYDRSGTYLLTSGGDGVIRWFGAGRSGVLAEGVLYANWS